MSFGSILEIPKDLRSTRLLVLAWTGHYFGSGYLLDRRVENPNGPDIELTITNDRGLLDDADAVWFHAPSIRDLPSKKKQPWVLMSMESDVNYPALKNPLVRLKFDLLMTYRLDADIPCIYPKWHEYGTFLDQPTRSTGPSSGAPAVYIASNPIADRDSYVAELMNHMPIDSLGRCLKNASVDGFTRGGGSSGIESLLSVLPRYKFYLAFENSITMDYVTEKVFHALHRGVVPVYRGAPNVREFMPSDDAVIDVFDFASPRELAEYLRYLDADTDAYAKHLRWKDEGYSDQFKKLLDLGSIHPLRRMAVKLAHGCNRDCRCGGRLRDEGVKQ